MLSGGIRWGVVGAGGGCLLALTGLVSVLAEAEIKVQEAGPALNRAVVITNSREVLLPVFYLQTRIREFQNGLHLKPTHTYVLELYQRP